MAITAVSQYMSGPLAGDIHGSDYDARSYINSAADVKAVTDVVITAVNSTAYTLKIAGITITVTSDGSATAAEIRDLLIAAIVADTYANALVTAVASGNNVRITERDANAPAPVTEADSNLALTVVTAHVDDEVIPFGIAVAKTGTDDKACGLPRGSSAVILGVVPRQHQASGPDPTADVWVTNSLIPVIYRGSVFVRVEEAVSAEDAAYVRHTASGANTQLGGFRKSADTATAAALTGAKFKTSAGSGGIARLAINLP